jgi:hypothetical protein
MLASWLPVETVPNKTYDGFTASAMHQDNGGLGNLLGVMWGSTNAVFYLADSLYYFIPEKYKGNKELILLQKNRIVLGAEIEIVFPQMRTKDSLSKIRQKITAEAISITQLAGNDNEFIIPADFVNKQNYAVATDTTIAVYDSTAPVPAKEAVRKKGPVEKPVPKSTSSSKAIRRKE